MSIYEVLTILKRAHNGPICSEQKWSSEIIPERTAQKLKEHGLNKTFDRNVIINLDDGLAKRFYKAAFELAVELGMLCLETERVIEVSGEELKEKIRSSPRQITVGEGADSRILAHRNPEDPKPPLMCAPLGIAVSEDFWVPLMHGIWQNPEIDMAQGGSLVSILGHEVLSGTPYETLLGRVHAQRHKEALWLAGRPGMPWVGVISAVTDLAQFTGYGLPEMFKPSDLALVLSPAELKTAYACLNKVIHAIAHGGRPKAGAASFIGGYAGSPEGAALVNIASALLRLFVHLSVSASMQIIDMRYNGNCGREGMWASSIASQAINSSTDLISDIVIDQIAGPNTEMLLYETAVGMMNFSVSGTGYSTGPRSGGGKYTDHLTPLECKLSGEVIKACAGMKRADANEIAKKLVPKYEAAHSSREPVKGDRFQDCYDVRTLQPSGPWYDKYRRVKAELTDLGIPLT